MGATGQGGLPSTGATWGYFPSPPFGSSSGCITCVRSTEYEAVYRQCQCHPRGRANLRFPAPKTELIHTVILCAVRGVQCVGCAVLEVTRMHRCAVPLLLLLFLHNLTFPHALFWHRVLCAVLFSQKL
jgi:hypothetical protein